MKLTNIVEKTYEQYNSIKTKVEEKINYEKEFITTYPATYFSDRLGNIGFISGGILVGYAILQNTLDYSLENLPMTLIGTIAGSLAGGMTGMLGGKIPGKIASYFLKDKIPEDIVTIISDESKKRYKIEYYDKPFDLKKDLEGKKKCSAYELYELKDGQFMKMEQEVLMAELSLPRVAYHPGEWVNARNENELLKYIMEKQEAKGKEVYLLKENDVWKKIN